MLTHYFHTRRLRASVRRCQTRLGQQLRRDYGAGQEYTLAQITRAMTRAELPSGDLELACAAFMTAPSFHATFPRPTKDYTSYRDALARHAVPRASSSSFEPAADNSDISAASAWPPS